MPNVSFFMYGDVTEEEYAAISRNLLPNLSISLELDRLKIASKNTVSEENANAFFEKTVRILETKTSSSVLALALEKEGKTQYALLSKDGFEKLLLPELLDSLRQEKEDELRSITGARKEWAHRLSEVQEFAKQCNDVSGFSPEVCLASELRNPCVFCDGLIGCHLLYPDEDAQWIHGRVRSPQALLTGSGTVEILAKGHFEDMLQDFAEAEGFMEDENSQQMSVFL